MNRRLLTVMAVAVAAAGLTACGGSSTARTRTVNGCAIKPATRCVGVTLARKQLFGARLARSDLRRADLRNADLRSANLTRADLRKANLQGTDLRGANLTGAKLAGANLVLAKLAKSDLRKADLVRANLIGANLTGAKVTRAALARARLCQTIGTNGRVDNSDCRPRTGGSTSSTTSTTAPRTSTPLPPFAVARFDAPSTYSCGSGSGGSGGGSGGGGGGGGERRQSGTGATGIATFSWSVPQAAQASFTFDGIRPSNVATNLPAIVANPTGQAAGDVANGAVTIAFACDRKPHVVDFVWTQANAAGVEIPGAPTVTRSATLTYAG